LPKHIKLISGGFAKAIITQTNLSISNGVQLSIQMEELSEY